MVHKSKGCHINYWINRSGDASNDFFLFLPTLGHIVVHVCGQYCYLMMAVFRGLASNDFD